VSAPLSYAEYRRQRYFAPLDGTRAVAVLLVAFVHARGDWHRLAGWNGVTIFFVLSGYLITTLALREESRAGGLDRASFYVRRCFRILPLYVVALLLFLGVDLVAGLATGQAQQRLLDALPFYLSPLPEFPHFFGRGGPFEIAWSLGIEEKFYLLWPLLAFGVPGLRGRFGRRLALTALLFAAAEAAPLAGGAGWALAPYGSILAGCTLALLLHQPHWFRRTGVLARPLPFTGVVAVLGCLQVLTAIEPRALQAAYSVTVAAAIAGVVLGAPGATRALATRPLRFVGRISYGLYLVHPLGLSAAAAIVPAELGGLGNALALLLGMVLAIALATVLHHTVEQPLIALGRSIAARRPAGDPLRTAPAAAHP